MITKVTKVCQKFYDTEDVLETESKPSEAALIHCPIVVLEL